MNTTRGKWKGWDVVHCFAGENVLTVGISAGPRIVSFTHNNGNNILYEDHTGFKVGEWCMYGGHRFTIAPEDEDSYYPDNVPCNVKCDDNLVQVHSAQRSNGLVLSLVIRGSDEGVFTIDHVLSNQGSTTWNGALWAITCVRRSDWLEALCETAHIHFWPGTDPSKWKQSNQKLSVAEGHFRGKAGWYRAFPEMTVTGQQGVFKISNPDNTAQALCIDNGCNTEIFVCAHYAELETLSEQYAVAPGAYVTHQQQWAFKPV